jgi:protocatechuate 3,4-dioxygenase beta subunit
MSDESEVTSQQPQQTIASPDGSVLRVPRREALKGLGALTAFAAVGCSSELTAESGEAVAPASGGPTAASSTPATATTAMTAQAGSSASTAVPASTMKPAMSGTAAPMGAAGSAAPASAGSAATSTAAAAGSGAAGSSAGAAGAASASAGVGAAAAGAADLSSLACILAPEMTEGPFFVEERLDKSDLVMGETDEAIVMATPLALKIGVYKVDGMMCSPLAGLQVDIWHADALGVYSDVASGFVQAKDTQGKKFLRGFQVTDESGMVEFATIYPGWYMSRTIHIHFKVRMPMGGDRAYDFTSQMFFDEEVSKAVLASGPYAKATGTRSVFNDDDHIFQGTPTNGQKPPAGQKAPGLDSMVTLVKSGAGYTGLLKVGLKI